MCIKKICHFCGQEIKDKKDCTISVVYEKDRRTHKIIRSYCVKHFNEFAKQEGIDILLFPLS